MGEQNKSVSALSVVRGKSGDQRVYLKTSKSILGSDLKTELIERA